MIINCIMKCVLLLYVIILMFSFVRCSLRSDRGFWKDLASKELKEALQVKWNLGVAKNVILFVGDGMDPNTVTATRIHKYTESGYLTFEKFPHVGLLKTYSNDKQVPDSSCSGTALFGGAKVNQETLGVDASVKRSDCEGSLKPENHIKTLATVALEAGKSAGIVTTMRVTHATPGAMFAHCPNRRWECEARKPVEATQCKDIARQLIEDEPGRSLHVMMGGGAQTLVSNVTGTPDDPIDTWSCYSQDGRDLISDWTKDKTERNLKSAVIRNNSDLQNLDVTNTDYLLGIFANGHIKLDHERGVGPSGMPSLKHMTDAAIKILSKNNNGFFLMVEGGNIDMSHHRGKAKKAISETVAFEEAIESALDMTNEEDTLIVVTSDHGHTLSINGYPIRGNDIFGIASSSKYDKINYTTLSYATGGPDSFHYKAVTNEAGEVEVERREPSTEDTTSYEYVQLASIRTDENTHSGGDVIVYAKGPYAHLFHNIHEQHYVFHAISYAASMGEFSDRQRSSGPKMTPQFLTFSFLFSLIVLTIIQQLTMETIVV